MAVVGIENHGDQPVQLAWYSFDGMSPQYLSQHLSQPPINPNAGREVPIRIDNENFKFEKGKKYKLKIATVNGKLFIFRLSFSQNLSQLGRHRIFPSSYYSSTKSNN